MCLIVFHAVISRNILNDPATSLQSSEDTDNTVVSPDNVPLPPDYSQSDPPDQTLSRLQQSPETPDTNESVELTLDGNQPSNNSNLAGTRRTDQVDLGMIQSTLPGSANLDPTKPAHADEMWPAVMLLLFIFLPFNLWIISETTFF